MATEILTFVTALGGGIISFVSPCVLPLVPAYLSFIAGESLEEMRAHRQNGRSAARRLSLMALVFVLGFSTVFVALGAGASAANAFLVRNQQLFSQIAGAVIILLGLHFTGIFRLALLNRDLRFHLGSRPAGWIGIYVIGLAFGFGWTPCIGPILGSILAIAATRDDIFYGVSLLSVYALGLGVPFVLAAMGLEMFMEFSQRIKPHMRKIEITAGILLIATGLLIFTSTLGTIANWMLAVFPWLQQLG